MTLDLAESLESEDGRARRGVAGRFFRDPLAIIGLVIIASLLVVAFIQDLIVPFPPAQVRLELTNALPFTTEYILGGDKYGRDILSQLIAGTRGAAVGVLIVVSISAVLGVAGGLCAGYFGGTFDHVGSWITAVVIAVPGIVVLIALYTVIGTSMPVAMAVLGVLVAPNFFWLARSLTRSVRNELYVDAARVAGLSNARIVGRHVLIAIRAPIIIMIAFLAGSALGLQAGLEFLGLTDPSQPSWGRMLTDAFNNIYIAGWQLVWPGLVLGLTMAAFVLVGNALRDALQGTYVRPSRAARRREVQRIRRRLGSPAPSGEAQPTPNSTAVRSAALLSIENLEIAYGNAGSAARVVRSVDVDVSEGEVVGLVGESGSGKSQVVFSALGLLPEEAVVLGGSIRFAGKEVLSNVDRRTATQRRKGMSYVPQEPMSNLDPSFRVGAQLVEGIRAQSKLSHREARQVALAALQRVGIVDPPRVFRSYPHQISGGMAQRVLIAGAVASKPRLLIADEPTTALDVTVQAEVLDLIRDLQKESGMGVLIVTHDLGVVADICQRVIVMREGEVVEQGPVSQVFNSPSHAYTRHLLNSVLDSIEESEPGSDLIVEGASRG